MPQDLPEKVTLLMQARADVARLTKEIAEDLGVTTASLVAAPAAASVPVVKAKRKYTRRVLGPIVVKPKSPAKFVANKGNRFARYQAVVGATKKGLSLKQIERETGISQASVSVFRREAYKKGDLKRAK